MLKIIYFSFAGRQPGAPRAVRLLFVLLCCLNYETSFAAQVFSCTQGANAKDLGVIEAKQSIKVGVFLQCKVLLNIAKSPYLQHQQHYGQSSGPALLIKLAGGPVIPSVESLKTNVCVPLDCYAGLGRPGETYAMVVDITGNASETPGSYSITVKLIANAPEASYAQVAASFHLSYTVPEPACSLGSASSLSLPFGTFNSDEFGSTQRIADISLNCTGTKNVSARLSPTQGIVSASAGLSATTLDGLLMAATWADNGTAVDFATPRSFALGKGANLIRLGFRPQLQPGAYPAGEFAGQYTLSLDYR